MGETRRRRAGASVARSWPAALLAVLVLLGGARSSPAQSVREDPPDFDGYNFAYATVLGAGLYDVNGRTALILRAPVTIPLRGEDEHGWGFRLLLPVTFGWFDVKPKDLVEEGLPEQFGTVSFVPGLEARRRITPRWLLRPFVNVGPAKDLEGGDVVWLAAVGARSRLDLPWSSRRWIIRNRLLYADQFSNSKVPDDDLAQFETEAELLQPVSRNTAVGLVLASQFYFDQVAVLTSEGEIFIKSRWEVGVSYGATEKLMWGRIAVPRVSVGYRFGQKVTGFRIGFQFDY